MGFFSQDCQECGHPAISYAAATEINDWMTHVVVITPDGDIHTGEYDGYGSVGGAEYAIGENNTVYHYACWVKLGKPMDYKGASRYAKDQGFFFDDEHNVPNPLDNRTKGAV